LTNRSWRGNDSQNKSIREANMRCAIAAVAVGAVIFAGVAQAQATDPFYAGNTVSIIVGSDAGGGHDLFARTLAKYFGRHIPGNPNIVVQNMAGANGLIAANHLANVAAKDGSVIGAISPGNILEPLLQSGQAARFDPRKMQWIGNIASIQLVCATWMTSAVKTVDDARQRQAVVGGGSSVSSSAILPTVMNELLGTKFKIVTGYRSGNVRIALERGEIDGICGWGYSTLLATAPDWIINHKLNFLAQSGLKRMKELPDTPLVSEFAQGEVDKAIFRLLTYRELLGRPYVAPPETPKHRVDILRKAFAEAMKDPDYLAEAKQAHQDVDFTDYRGMESVIADAYAMPQEIVRRVAALTRAKGK
jgi:tripartite-type tricarboxylate transporter receptor subunit TctC